MALSYSFCLYTARATGQADHVSDSIEKNIRGFMDKKQGTYPAVIVFGFLFFLLFFPDACMAQKLKIGFIYVSPISDAGWTYSHDMGRKDLETIPGLDLKFVESVDEGIQSEPILEYFAKNKYDLIFATSFGYMDPVIKTAKMYPDSIFMHCSGYKQAKNVGTYFGRIYQSQFLTGMVAGAMTKSNKIGYVAPFQIPEVIRGINAFTLGVRSGNPEAEVHVLWTHSWYNPEQSKLIAETLIDRGVDILAQGQDSPAVQVIAEQRKVFSIGYNTDMSKFAPSAHLTAPVWNWKVLYRYIVDQVKTGKWASESLWWGMEKGAVDIAPLSSLVPETIRNKVQMKKQEIIDAVFVVFQGPVRDQLGVVRIPENSIATDDQLLNMKWFVEGVVGQLD